MHCIGQLSAGGLTVHCVGQVSAGGLTVHCVVSAVCCECCVLSGRGCVSVVSVVCCEVEVSASG